MKIVLCTGGYDPLHSGHIAYFEAAKRLGDELWVGVNSDAWLTRKKGRPFMPFSERANLVKNLKPVDQVLGFEDDELGSSNCCIEKILNLTGANTKIIVANGGDRNSSNIPEVIKYGDHPRIEFAWSVGGSHKANSSSWILKQALLTHHETRVWGKFFDLYQAAGYKVKELVIEPNKGISYQRHFCRGEVWFVQSGCGYVKIGQDHNPLINYTTHKLETHSVFRIKPTQWHQLYNTNTEPLVIVEIQYGSQTTEDDIERIEYYKDQA